MADVLTMAAIRLLGIPQVYTAHELLPWTARRHHRWLFSRLYAVVDAIIVHSDSQRTEIIREFSVPPSKIRVANLGDYALFATPQLPQSEARARFDLPPEAPVALFFGTLRPSKGLEVLIDAWAVVTKRLPDAILVITGKPFKGLNTAKIVDRIERLGIENSIRSRFEQVDPEETNAYYRAADVIVLPYHQIGTSGVLRYAYNSARPVIATAIGEHTERVIPGQTGHLVPPHDPLALAEVLATSLNDRSKLSSMGKAAQQYAVANLSWAEPAREMLRTYQDVRKRQ
jgi:glycosyltransferase involved in cell wall biosynthesis